MAWRRNELWSLVPTIRRLLGRRASQNVVSWADSGKAGAIVLVAHCDAGRSGLAHNDATARRKAALSRLVHRPIGGLQPLFWAELGVLACALLRLAGLDGTPLTVVQFVPTLALIVAVALLVDIALAGTRAGENDNASGVVVVMGLVETLGGALEHFDLHALFTGSNKAGAAGMRAFLAKHPELARDTTIFVNVDQVGSGAVRGYLARTPGESFFNVDLRGPKAILDGVRQLLSHVHIGAAIRGPNAAAGQRHSPGPGVELVARRDLRQNPGRDKHPIAGRSIS